MQPRAISFAALLALSTVVHPAAAQQGTPFSTFMKESDLRDDIERWRKTTETLYEVRYERRVSIVIEPNATAYLWEQYAKITLAPEYSANKPLSRFVIRRAVSNVLGAAYIHAISITFRTWDAFLAAPGTPVPISTDHVRVAIAGQGCNGIPCPPEKCKEDCSASAFKRFTALAPLSVAWMMVPGACPLAE
jgi:hypothetical protein